MTTLANIITTARTLLNDNGTTKRYSDADLLAYANEAIRQVRLIRPDLFFGGYTTSLSTLSSSDNSPIDVMYDAAIADYIVGRSESRDDDYATNGRAAAFLTSFRASFGV